MNGVLLHENKILLVKHTGIGAKGHLWIPPGGGMEFGQSATENLEREFLEETGLRVRVTDFLFVCELVQKPLHAVELFFQVALEGGTLKKGHDPELSKEKQIIKEVKFLSLNELNKIPPSTLHSVLQELKSFEELLKRHGYFQI